jgi:hypothetical protein
MSTYVISNRDLDGYRSGVISENLGEIVTKVITSIPILLQNEAKDLKIQLVRIPDIDEYTDSYELTFSDASEELQEALNNVDRVVIVYEI